MVPEKSPPPSLRQADLGVHGLDAALAENLHGACRQLKQVAKGADCGAERSRVHGRKLAARSQERARGNA